MKKITDRIIPLIMRFANLKGIIALRDGMSAILAATIIGSVFLLIAEFPYAPVKEFFANVGVSTYFYQIYNATFNTLALICSFSIAYHYTKNENIEPLGSAITSTISFIIICNQYLFLGDEKVTGILSLSNNLGSRGMIAAIIVALISAYIYCYCIKNNITIKMPETVPDGVKNSFSALVPGLIILSIWGLIYGLINYFSSKDLVDVIYSLIQTPLQNLTDSLFGVMAIAFLIPFLWWFGIHGNNVIGGVMTAIWLSGVTFNQDLINKGIDLTVANGGKIATYQFNFLLNTMTGSGITIGIALALLLRARSKQYKQIGKLSIIPAMFNINEPIIFGIPVVFNPILFIPFVGVPMIASFISYISLKTGLVPLFAGVNPPWTTPPILSGLLAGGPKMALLQLIIIIISIVVYYPFIMYLDKKAKAQEE